MTRSLYAAGDFLHLVQLCYCQARPNHGVDGHATDCWHSSGTIVRRVFWDGGILLENLAGYVRAAHPDEVGR